MRPRRARAICVTADVPRAAPRRSRECGLPLRRGARGAPTRPCRLRAGRRADHRRGAVDRRRGWWPLRLVLRAHRSVPVPRAGLHVRRGLHDRSASRARLAGARRPESAPPRAARERGGAQPARRLVRTGLRPERVVLRVGGCGAACARHSQVIEAHFGETPAFSLGVEEELMILDAETLDPVGAVEVLLRGTRGLDLPGSLKTEMHASVIELNTGICGDVAEAVAALKELRLAAVRVARANGLVVAAAG